MRCARCNAENPAGMRFCGQCGDSLEGSVAPGFAEPGIDSLAPALRRTPGGRARAAGEMKQVTALFCDIVGSSELTERLGAERMHALVSEFLDTALAEVRRYEGTAPQFGGDGFMALFGAPVAQEDHVRRALLAALAIRRVLGGEGGETGDMRMNLPVRIGIHTGPVVFAPVADSFRMATAIGSTANVAARLQTAAEPGTIVVSETTRLAARGYARVDRIGPLALKGIPEPVVAYRLLGVSHRRAAPARATPFFDRERDLALLEDWLRLPEAGHGRAVAIVGEPGIGKSRLLAEFRRRIAGRNAAWIEGRCHSYATAIPYSLTLDLLRAHCGIVETDGAQAIAEKLRRGLREVGMDPDEDGPVLLHLLGIKDAGGSAGPASPETVKAKAFEVLNRLCIEGSRRRPLIVVLEDLHWVDKPSEEVCEVFAANIVDARILLLAAHRPEYRAPWAYKPHARLIALRPLSRSDSLRVVRAAPGGENLPTAIAGEIVAKGDGNPLFLEQMALHAGESDAQRLDLRVPDTVHEVVMARIDRLPEESKQLLQTAAVIGREFSLRLLRAVSEDPGSVEDRLRELKRLEFIDERLEPEGIAYVFRHWLTQEAAYGSLLDRHRRAYHADIGHALEQLYDGRADEVAELLALHFGRSDEGEKAVDYAVLAAEKAQRRWANNDALSYFNDAVRRLDPLPDTEPNRLRRIDAVLKQVEVKFALGQQAEHLTALENIRSAVEAAGDPRRRASWHCWTGYLHGLTGGSAALAIEHCREAAAIAAASRCDDIEGFIYSCAVQAYLFGGELRAANEAGDHAVAILERQSNLWWASRTLWNTAQAAIYLGEWEAGIAYCRRVLAHAGTLDDRRLKVVGLYRLGSVHIFQGDIERGLRCCEEALTFNPLPFDIAMVKVFHGYGEIKAGRLDAGIAELAEAVAWFDRLRLDHVRVTPALRLAEGYLHRGELGAARTLIEDVLTASQAKGYRYVEGLAHRLLAECLAGESPVGAMEHVTEAQWIFEAVGARNDLAQSLVTRAKLSQSNSAEARGLLEDAAAIFKALGTLGEPDRVSAALAALDRGSPT